MCHAKSPLSLRLLSLLFAVVLAVGMCPLPALAASGDTHALLTGVQAELAMMEDATQAIDATAKSLSVEGDVSVSDNTFAAKVRSDGEGVKHTLDIGGSVTNATESKDSIYSLIAYGFDGGESRASVGGNVVAGLVDKLTQFKKTVAVFIKAESGTASVEITGDAVAVGTDDVSCMKVQASENSISTVKVSGNVSATSSSSGDKSYDAFAIDAQAGNNPDAADDSSNVSFDIGGNITAKAEGSSYANACGVILNSLEGATCSVAAHGDVSAIGVEESAGAKVSAAKASKSLLVVDGNVSGSCDALGAGAWVESIDGGTAGLVVKGTVSGTTVGLLFDGNGETNYDIAVWKVEVGEGGSLFKKGGHSEGVPDDLSSQVNYIMKVEQPPVGGALSVVSEQKGALEKSSGLDVARAGDKVYLKADLDPGYFLNAAYNGKGQRVPLERDEGGYYVIVPEGGGVYLSVDLTQSEGSATDMSIVDGMAQHVFAYSDVREKGYTNANSELYRFVVYVETDYDTDQDGQCDLVKTYVQVPRAAVEGTYQAPTIFTANPYSAGMRASGNAFKYESESIDDKALMNKPAHRTPSSSITSKDLALDSTLTKASDWSYELDSKTYPNEIDSLDYYLVRGFAIVQAAGLGTYGSEGIECCGTVMERDAFVDVVEWLHGNVNRKAYADPAGTVEVKATDWSSGHVGMTGLSYPGAMCYEVATSGVDGLDTIVPVAGPSSWYDHSNSQGISTSSNGSYNYTTVLADTCASRLFPQGVDQRLLTLYQQYRTYMSNAQVDLQGDYGPYWAARDWYTGQTGIKASALIVTGLNDENVSTKHFDLMRNAFLASGCEVKSLLHQNAHIMPANSVDNSDIMIKNHTYREWLNLWFTRALLDVDNEASALPDFTVQSNVDGSFYDSDVWNGDDAVTMHPNEEGETTISAKGASTELGELVTDVFKGSSNKNAACWSLAVCDSFTIAGRIPVHVRAKVDDVREGDIMMSAVLVDVADKPFSAFAVDGSIENEVVKKGGGNSLSYDLVKWKQGQTTKKVVSTGTIDLRNPEAGYEPASATKRVEPITANTYYNYTIYLNPTYYTVQEGHHLELYIVPFLDYTRYANDEARDYLFSRSGLDPSSAMNIRTDYTFTIDNANSSAALPVTTIPKPVDIANATVAKVAAKTYTGKAIEPSPSVTYKGMTLREGSDYMLSYKDNKKAGTASVVITGKGAFEGAKTVSFTIKQANVKKAAAKKLKARNYTGKAIKPSPTLTYKGKKLKKGADYKLSYKDNKKRGTAKVIVTGKGNFKGKKTLKFTIK